MLKTFCILWALCALSYTPAGAAEISPPTPLAFITAPSCSKRPGVRAVRSDLVQLGEVTASLSAQASRENGACIQNAALWVTQKGVSQQFELRDAATATFTLLDISPNSSTLLLSSVASFPNPEDDHSSQLAILSLADGVLKWTPTADLLGLQNCDAVLEPQGFLDLTHILVTAFPSASARKHPSCTTETKFFSLDIATHMVKPSPQTGVQRFAQAVAGPVQSCKSDPDVIAACYTARARLSLMDNGDGMVVWPVGAAHLMAVEEGMLPSSLSSKIGPHMRVYATMVICPLTVDQPSPRPHICIDAATDFHPDPLPAKTAVHTAIPAKPPA